MHKKIMNNFESYYRSPIPESNFVNPSEGTPFAVVETQGLGIVTFEVVSLRGANTYAPGIAHLAEHLMFKRGAVYRHKEITDFLNSVGGFNASTSKERLNYHFACLPKDDTVARGLNMFEDILRPNRVKLQEKDFNKEINIVQAEIKQFLSNGTQLSFSDLLSRYFNEPNPIEFSEAPTRDAVEHVHRNTLTDAFIFAFCPPGYGDTLRSIISREFMVGVIGGRTPNKRQQQHGSYFASEKDIIRPRGEKAVSAVGRFVPRMFPISTCAEHVAYQTVCKFLHNEVFDYIREVRNLSYNAGVTHMENNCYWGNARREVTLSYAVVPSGKEEETVDALRLFYDKVLRVALARKAGLKKKLATCLEGELYGIARNKGKTSGYDYVVDPGGDSSVVAAVSPTTQYEAAKSVSVEDLVSMCDKVLHSSTPEDIVFLHA